MKIETILDYIEMKNAQRKHLLNHTHLIRCESHSDPPKLSASRDRTRCCDIDKGTRGLGKPKLDQESRFIALIVSEVYRASALTFSPQHQPRLIEWVG